MSVPMVVHAWFWRWPEMSIESSDTGVTDSCQFMVLETEPEGIFFSPKETSVLNCWAILQHLFCFLRQNHVSLH